MGIVVEGAEGRFRDCRLNRLSFAGVRLLGASSATFDELIVTDTPVGLDARGTSVGRFDRAMLSECRPLAVSVVDEARLTISESVVADSGAGAGVQGSASLVVKSSELRDLESFGMIAMATSTLVLDGSRLLRPGAIGVIGLHDAFVDVRDTTVKDAADIGFRLLDKCSGQIAGCTDGGRRARGDQERLRTCRRTDLLASDDHDQRREREGPDRRAGDEHLQHPDLLQGVQRADRHGQRVRGADPET
ncbi:right-handed parallel beta-helix repeat-containing protein [Nocardioides sp. NPDC047086]|uniref:right-handed parallel beta-helix repeat-containing protein n=1 Tax=Nocardioides sp. NPDC047086 TaxID=3154810 RepID=UPI0033D1CBAD